MGFSVLSSGSNLASNRSSRHFACVASWSGPLIGHSRLGWDGVVEQLGTIRQPGLRPGLKRRGTFFSITRSLSFLFWQLKHSQGWPKPAFFPSRGKWEHLRFGNEVLRPELGGRRGLSHGLLGFLDWFSQNISFHAENWSDQGRRTAESWAEEVRSALLGNGGKPSYLC